MGPTSVRQTRLAHVPTASIALFVDAGYVRRCAARTHEIAYGSPIQASRVSIDAGRISSLLDSLIIDFDLEASPDGEASRPERRIYDTVSDDRRQRWRQPHYRSALRAEGFVLRTLRAPCRPAKPGTVVDARDRCDLVEAALADDLIRRAGELSTVVVLAGGAQTASAVWAAREQGAEVVLAIPLGCGALVAEGLRETATRVIGLHPEVFEALFEVRDACRQRAAGRASGLPARVGVPG